MTQQQADNKIKQLLDSTNEADHLLALSIAPNFGWSDLDLIYYVLNSNKNWIPYICWLSKPLNRHVKYFINAKFQLQTNVTSISMQIETENGAIYLSDNYLIDDFHYDEILNTKIKPIISMVAEQIRAQNLQL